MSENTNRPRFHAFTKVEGKQKTTWLRIGAAFSIRDGKGLSIKLNALPVDGQIILFEPKAATSGDDADQPF